MHAVILKNSHAGFFFPVLFPLSPTRSCWEIVPSPQTPQHHVGLNLRQLNQDLSLLSPRSALSTGRLLFSAITRVLSLVSSNERPDVDLTKREDDCSQLRTSCKPEAQDVLHRQVQVTAARRVDHSGIRFRNEMWGLGDYLGGKSPPSAEHASAPVRTLSRRYYS